MRKVRLKFNCDQDWDGMAPTDRGKFCEVCNKEVYDYTSFSLKEILEERSNNAGELCGYFKAEQVDHRLIEPIETPRKLRVAAFWSAFLLSSTGGIAHAQQAEPTIVNVDPNNNQPNLPEGEIKEKIQNGERINMSVGHSAEATPIEHKKGRLKKVKNKKWYWDRRFPFIHRTRTRFMGVSAYH
ncbi:MAG: hypothetical protein QNK23_12765 [Crocinitomicaceae bacterium]|nr:hypothetical protein [Crocinitomicaceae bacterium]